MRTLVKRVILSVFVAGLVVISGEAQTGGIGDPGVARGTPRSSYALSGIDNVNYFNGNLSVSIPTASIGGIGEASRAIKASIEQRWTAYQIGGGSYLPWGDLQPLLRRDTQLASFM